MITICQKVMEYQFVDGREIIYSICVVTDNWICTFLLNEISPISNHELIVTSSNLDLINRL